MNTPRTLAAALALTALPACSEGKPTKYWEDFDMDGYGKTDAAHYAQYHYASEPNVYPELTCKVDEIPAYKRALRVEEITCATREELNKQALKAMAPRSGDCDDSDATINPKAEEIFDGEDNNCDGLVDISPAPEGLDPLYEKITANGKAMFASDPTTWEQVLSELGEKIGWGLLQASGGYGFKAGSSFLKDLASQEKVYAWALPYVSYRVGRAGTETRETLANQLEAAAAYASTLDVKKERTYLQALQAKDCTDIYRNNPHADLGQNGSASCQQFFIYYGPDAPWERAIREAKRRTKERDYVNGSLIFSDDPPFTKNRDLQARLYRRVANGEVTEEGLQQWIARVRTDLASALGAVEQ